MRKSVSEKAAFAETTAAVAREEIGKKASENIGPEANVNLVDEASETIGVLLVMEPESPGFAVLLACLETLRIELTVVSDCRGVRRQLSALRPAVVLSGVTLCDGNWCEVLNSVVESGVAASVLVYSHEPDQRLRAEVLARGAYALLSGPLYAPDLLACIGGAHLLRHQAPLEDTVPR